MLIRTVFSKRAWFGLRGLVCALALAIGAPVLFAQFDTAAVLGTIRDSSGAVIPKASVKLLNLDTGVTTNSVSGEQGEFQFLDVKIGAYRLEAVANGFSSATTDSFRVTVGARQRVDLILPVGSVSETVVVNGAAKLLETESSDRGQIINQNAVVDLPLNGRSNAALMLLAPGVRQSYGLSGREASFNVNGQRSEFNNFILDGVDNNAYGTSNQGLSNQVIQLAPDAVQEFKVVADNYSAEYGRAGGAVINASMRSGTNRLHGAAWEFLRNTDLNAVGFFKPTGGQKPVLIQNQFGAAVGGPIRKDKVFIFGDYEGLRARSKKLLFATVPTMDQRNGILGVPVKNPYTGEIYSNGMIPSSEITPFAAKVLADLPSPNLNTSSNNYASLPRQTDQDDKGDVRVDYFVSPRINSFIRLSEHLFNETAPGALQGPSGQGDGRNSRVYNYQVAVGATWAMDLNSLLDFRFGIDKTEGSRDPATMDGGPDMLQAYGIPGLPTDSYITGGLNTQKVSGYTTMGRDWSSPQHQDPSVINPKVNYSRIYGKHSFKAGYEFQAVNTVVEDFHPKYGQDTYDQQFSRPASVTKKNNLYNLADFMFGARSQYYLSNMPIANMRQRMHFLYVQDNVNPFSKLSLNLGVRYEYSTPWYERDNKMSNFDPATNSLVHASSSDRYLVNPDKNNFAPRVGLAYTLNSRAVIRSGYGISYIDYNRLGSDWGLQYNGPDVIVSLFNQNPSMGLCTSTVFSPTCFLPTQMGYPEGFVAADQFDTSVSKVMYTPRNTPTAYVQSWHASVQVELAKDLMLDMAYVGSRGKGIIVLADYNEAYPNAPGGNLAVKDRRPLQDFGLIDMGFAGGATRYNAMQIKLERKYSGGLYFLNSFTWSKAEDTMASAMEKSNGDGTGVDIRGLRYGGLTTSNYDQPFNNTTSLIWELPYGRGRHFGANAGVPLQMLLGGWRLSAINTMVSGMPISLTYSPTAEMQVTDTLSSSAIAYNANVLGNPLVPAGQRTPAHYFDASMVAEPTDVTHPFGNAERNSERSNSIYQLDLSLQKEFPLPRGEDHALEFRAEFFNALNKTNFNAAASNISSSNFGTITSTLPARQIQFGLKLSF